MAESYGSSSRANLTKDGVATQAYGREEAFDWLGRPILEDTPAETPAAEAPVPSPREQWGRLPDDQRNTDLGEWYRKLQAGETIEDWQRQALKNYNVWVSDVPPQAEAPIAPGGDGGFQRIRDGIKNLGARGKTFRERVAQAAVQVAAADKGNLGEWARRQQAEAVAAEAPAETPAAEAAADEAARQQAVEAARLAEERRQAEQAEVARMIIDELKAEAEAARIVNELKAEAPEAVAAEKKAWREAAGEMGEDTFATIGFENSGKNEIVAAAAFEFRAEIASGAMTREMFTAMMREVNGIAKSYEAQLGRPEEQKLPWPQVAGDMSRNNIAGTAFETTGSRIAAAAGYRFRQGISTSQDQGASFKEMMREINGVVGKYTEKMGK